MNTVRFPNVYKCPAGGLWRLNRSKKAMVILSSFQQRAPHLSYLELVSNCYPQTEEVRVEKEKREKKKRTALNYRTQTS